MNSNTIFAPIDNGLKQHIKDVVKKNYGFIPTDVEIDMFDQGLREAYPTLHPYRIINHLATSSKNKIILQYRECLGTKLEEIQLKKMMFKYLQQADMSFNEAIPHGSICLCRTAIEVGLRERIAEEFANMDFTNKKKLEEKIFEHMEKLKKTTLGNPNGGLIKIAEHIRLLGKEEIEKMFDKNFGPRYGRNVLDKFIHGDIFAINDILKDRREVTSVYGVDNILDEKKIIADIASYDIAYEVLKITTEIAEILYLK